jgi:hypothetical protein
MGPIVILAEHGSKTEFTAHEPTGLARHRSANVTNHR